MKILHVSTFFEPELGYEEYCTAKEQAKDRHDVHVICTNLRSDRNLKGKDRYLPLKSKQDSNIIIHRLPCLPELKSEFVIPITFKKTLNAINPDIIHAHTATQFTSWMAVKYARKNNIPIIVDIHGIGWQKKNSIHPMSIVKNTLNIFFHSLVKSTIIKSNMLVPKAKKLKQLLLSNYNIKENKILINEIGVDTDVFFKSESIRKLTRDKYLITEHDRVLIFFGFIRKEKRLDIILNALSNLPENYKLIIAGAIDSDVENDNLIKKYMHQLSKRLIVKGSVSQPDLNRLINASDLVLWPANISVGILQSSIIGLPSIYPAWAYDFYPISKKAIFSDSKLEFVNKIRTFFDDKNYYIVESKKAQDYALDRTYKIQSKKLIHLYQNLINEANTNS